MKAVLAAVILGLWSGMPRGQAAEKTDPDVELKSLVGRVNAKLEAGKITEADLAPEIKEFGGLLQSHKDEKTDNVARILYMEAKLYLEVFNNVDKGLELVEQLHAEFPQTRLGQNVPELIAELKVRQAAEKIRRTLVAGVPFPDFDETDITGKPISISKYKGKVVLIDFWATWCPLCVHEIPNLMAAYEKHHDKGFEIIGVNLDHDKQRVKSFTQDKKISWPQYYDDKSSENRLAQKCGIMTLPATFLLDGDGKIIAHDLFGPALDEAVTKALAKQKSESVEQRG